MGSTGLELYAVQTGTLGVVVTDGEGRVLYGSDGDQADPPQSHCTDACAQAWLPLTVPAGQEPQLLGVEATAVGRLARPDGSSQLTLGGWPVYVNRSDDGQLKQAAPGLQSAGLVRDVAGRGEGRAACGLTVRCVTVRAPPPQRTSRRRCGYRAPLPRVASPDQRFSDQVTTRMVREGNGAVIPRIIAPSESSPSLPARNRIRPGVPREAPVRTRGRVAWDPTAAGARLRPLIPPKEVFTWPLPRPPRRPAPRPLPTSPSTPSCAATSGVRSTTSSSRLKSELAQMKDELADAQRKRRLANEHAEATERELRDLRAKSAHSEPRSVEDSFGYRAEKLLRIAEQEAAEVRTHASRESAAIIEQARTEAEKHRHEVEQSLIARAAVLEQQAAQRNAELQEREQQIADQLSCGPRAGRPAARGRRPHRRPAAPGVRGRRRGGEAAGRHRHPAPARPGRAGDRPARQGPGRRPVRAGPAQRRAVERARRRFRGAPAQRNGQSAPANGANGAGNHRRPGTNPKGREESVGAGR